MKRKVTNKTLFRVYVSHIVSLSQIERKIIKKVKQRHYDSGDMNLLGEKIIGIFVVFIVPLITGS